ncbi:MAG TPA: hypothetical protein VK304_10630 [Thermoleophilaceae bacterium]|nr:hypothetical protein [Thermoleophilaceae bacterium]
MLDRLQFPLDLRMLVVSSVVAGSPRAKALLKPERRECTSCGAHAYAVCGKGRCGNCGGAALQPVR